MSQTERLRELQFFAPATSPLQPRQLELDLEDINALRSGLSAMAATVITRPTMGRSAHHTHASTRSRSGPELVPRGARELRTSAGVPGVKGSRRVGRTRLQPTFEIGASDDSNGNT